MSSSAWRLAVTPPLCGRLNMAVDWWLVNNSPAPVFRIYSWSKPTVSIGYRQQFQPPDQLAKLADNYPLVVRPTGGGYLLHADEITFSFYIPPRHRFAEFEILEFYELTCESFRRVLNKLGLNNIKNVGKNLTERNPDSCLAAPERHEPVIGAKKWLAAAQVRHRGSILEQGSIFWSKNNWPDSNLLDLPFFISDNIETSKQKFIKTLIPEIQEVMGIKTFRTCEFSNQDWRKVKKIASGFQVDKPEQLPVFRRY